MGAPAQWFAPWRARATARAADYRLQCVARSINIITKDGNAASRTEYRFDNTSVSLVMLVDASTNSYVSVNMSVNSFRDDPLRPPQLWLSVWIVQSGVVVARSDPRRYAGFVQSVPFGVKASATCSPTGGLYAEARIVPSGVGAFVAMSGPLVVIDAAGSCPSGVAGVVVNRGSAIVNGVNCTQT